VAIRYRLILAPLAIALGVVGLHLCCGNRYGFFRDELYFVACGKRLAWGYVDQPPLVALLARFAWRLSGEGRSVLLFRVPAALCQGGTVVLAGALTALLGGGPFAAALAATAVAVAPVHLAQGHLVTMNVVEQLLWMAAVFAAAVAATGRPRFWMLAGALLGVAMVNKYSGAFLAVALICGLLATSGRAHLRSGYLWAGVAIAAAVALPTALWQLRHGLPFLELLHNGQRYKNAAIPAPEFLGEVILEQGPGGCIVALAGAAWLLAAPAARPFRFLGVGLCGLLVVLVVMHAKPYYLAPGIAPLFASGAVAIGSARLRGWMRGLVVALVVLSAAPGVPLVLPLLPVESMLAWQTKLGVKPQHLEHLRYNDVPQHFADQFGWRERVRAVEEVVANLTPAERSGAAVYTDNYGRAAALELFGVGLPPVVSGHNQYYLWGVPGSPQVVVALGGDADDYSRDFAEVSAVGRTPEVPLGMPYESAVPIFLLKHPRAPFPELFRASKHFE
jgi:4-amino-4-deoxy-L-arabinose transferase-like glycosyltransferase